MPIFHQKFVLVVEDDDSVLWTFQRVFGNQEFASLDFARTLQEATDKIKFVLYDFIFLDMKLDQYRHGGLMFLRELNRIAARITREGGKPIDSRVVIMSSSVPLQEVLREANDLGVISFLDKPFDFNEAYVYRVATQMGVPLHPPRTREP